MIKKTYIYLFFIVFSSRYLYSNGIDQIYMNLDEYTSKYSHIHDRDTKYRRKEKDIEYNYDNSENKISFKKFKEITQRYTKEEIRQCKKKSNKLYYTPKHSMNVIQKIENPKELTYAINCNNGNKYNYTNNIYKNYLNYFNCNDNIDVGYMQINYKIWKKEYPDITIETLLDPCKNIQLGHKILNNIYISTKGDFWKTIGYYHSRTKKYFKRYIQKGKKIYRNILKRS